MQLIQSFDKSARELMELDSALLDSISAQAAALHIFRWPRPCISLGCLFNNRSLLKPQQSDDLYERVTRPTGGGVMIHGSDLGFSLIAGPLHPYRQISATTAYEALHRHLLLSLEALYPVLKGRMQLIKAPFNPRDNAYSCCLSHAVGDDLAIDNKKVLGSAQRRKKGVLHQGSLHLSPPDWDMVKNLFEDGSTYATIIASTSTWLSDHVKVDAEELVEHLTEKLRQFFREQLYLEIKPL